MNKIKPIIATLLTFTFIWAAGCSNKKPPPVQETTTEATTTVTEAVTTTTPVVTTAPPPDERVAENYEINSDVAGWIKIDGTSVDYPILQGKDNDFYLSRDINKNYLFAGSIYFDYRDNFGFSEGGQSDNLVIYGHNMNNGSMFGTLKKYRQTLDYINQYPIIELSSRYTKYNYVIFAIADLSAYAKDGFPYWQIHFFENETAFKDFTDTVLQRSMVPAKTDVKYGDKLLSLSTCSTDGRRFVVFGRRLRDGETPEQFKTSPATTTTAATT